VIPGGDERLRRWRLVLGGGEDGIGMGLAGTDAGMDAALAALDDRGPEGLGQRGAGLEASAPRVGRWTAPRACSAHGATPTWTGTAPSAPSAPTCGTICPSSARSYRSG
jgi:hypothetical protein